MSAKFVSLISIKDLVIKNDEIFIETIYGNFIPVNGKVFGQFINDVKL